MNNIFENAKFGDKFVTKDGRQTLYIYECKSSSKYSDYPIVHKLWIVGEEEPSIFGPDGNINPYETRVCDENGIVEQYSDDIIGRYIEPIDEEKLEVLAYTTASPGYQEYWAYEISQSYMEGFIIGYRKAKENDY